MKLKQPLVNWVWHSGSIASHNSLYFFGKACIEELTIRLSCIVAYILASGPALRFQLASHLFHQTRDPDFNVTSFKTERCEAL